MGKQYGKLERGLADMLAAFPGAKGKIKKAYQVLNFYRYRKPYTFQTGYELHTLPLTQENFFGYYDKPPLSFDNRFILFNRANESTRLLPDAGKEITICLYDTLEKRISFEHPTCSYNWQQGAKAQWLTEKEFIFNEYDAEGSRFRAVIAQADGQEKRFISRPVYDCFRDQYALTLDFRRLMALRPDYGYRNATPLTKLELKQTDEDGIFYVDLKTNSEKLLISLSRLKKISPSKEMDKALHKVNHIMISPDGKHFIFLHRFFVNGRKSDRLLVAARDGEGLKLLANAHMVSHCCWFDNDHIIGYLRDAMAGDRYYKINIITGARSVVGQGRIDRFGDGHPGIFGHKMILDTYPDRSRMKHLLLFDLDTGELVQLGEFYEGFGYYGQTRCDLHPRFSFDGKRVFFDSVHEGKRKLYWIDL